MSVTCITIMRCFLLVLALMMPTIIGAAGAVPHRFMTRSAHKKLMLDLAKSLYAALYSLRPNDEAINNALSTIEGAFVAGDITQEDKDRLLNKPTAGESYAPIILLLHNKIPLTMRLFQGEFNAYTSTPLAQFIGMGGDLWDCGGRTAFQIALDAGNLAAAYCIMSIMVDKNPDKLRSYVDDKGKNFLHYVAGVNLTFPENIPSRFLPMQTAFKYMISLLMHLGVDSNALDNAGKSPFYYALGKRVIARLLLEKGAVTNTFCSDFEMTLYERFVSVHHYNQPGYASDMALAARSFVHGEIKSRNVTKLLHFFSQSSYAFIDDEPLKQLSVELSKEFINTWRRKDTKLVASILVPDNVYAHELLLNLIQSINEQEHVLYDAVVWGDEQMLDALITLLKQLALTHDLCAQLKLSYYSFGKAVGYALFHNNEAALSVIARHVPPEFNKTVSIGIIMYLSSANITDLHQQYINRLIKFFRPTLNYRDKAGNTILHHAYARNMHAIIAAIEAYNPIADKSLLNSAGNTPTECASSPRFLGITT